LKARALAAAARPPCAPGTTGILYKVGLQDLRGPDGLPYSDASGAPQVTLALRTRVSHVYGCPDCMTRDCSVPDVALEPIPLVCREGTCRAGGIVESPGAGVNIDLIVAVHDPTDVPLARAGQRVRGGPVDPGFPTTWQAKVLQANLVASVAECTTPTVLAGEMPACQPVMRSSYRFGSDGWGLVVLKRSGDQSSLKVKLKDVRDNTHAPATGVFMLTYVDRRTSFGGCTTAPCTRADTLFTWPIVCQSGRCSAKAKLDDPGFEGGSIELDALTVRDPLGLPFAVPGLKTR
jgi:hypothetical protein